MLHVTDGLPGRKMTELIMSSWGVFTISHLLVYDGMLD